MEGTALAPDPLGEDGTVPLFSRTEEMAAWGGYKGPKKVMVLTQHVQKHLSWSCMHPA